MALKGWKRSGREGKFALFSLSLPSLFSARHAGYRPLMATEFSPFCSKKMNNGIHWISLYPLVNAIGFPTPGIWPLNLPGEPSWRERHSLSSCLGRIGIRGGRFELEGTRNPEREIIWWSLKPVYRVACRGPLLQLLLLVKSFQRVVSQKKKAKIRADSFLFLPIRHSFSSKFHIWKSVYFSNNL